MQLTLKVDLQHEVFGLFENIHHQVSINLPGSYSDCAGVEMCFTRYLAAQCLL